MEIQAARRDYLWCGLSLLLLLGMQLVAGVLIALLMLFASLPQELFMPVTLVVSTVVGDLPPILLLSRMVGIPLKSLFTGEHHLEKWVGPGFLMMVGASFASGYLAVAIEALLSAAGIELWSPELTLPFDLPGCVLMLLAVSVLAPLLEELLFRGLLLRTFTRYGPRFAIFASAMLFAFTHGNLTQGVGTFFMGILLAVIAQRAGSVLPTVMIHMFYNTFAMLINTAVELPSEVAVAAANGFFVIFGLVCVGYLVVRYLKRRPVFPPKCPESKPFGFRRLLRSWPVDVFLVLCFLMALVPAQMH